MTTTLLPVSLREAEMSLAVANTPMFLVLRLREDPAVRRALELHGAKRIFSALETATRRKATDLSEATEPYFYLVALSLDPDLSWLQRASSLPASDIKWFKEISEYLNTTSRATVRVSLDANPAVVVDPPQQRSATANISTSLRVQ